MPPLLIDRPDDGVVLVTLNLPEVRNAMTDELTEAWTTEIPKLAGDTSVRVVVVTGAGSAFCAGGNLSWLNDDNERTFDGLRARMAAFYRRWLVIRDLGVPTIAALNGHAVGAGLAVAMACDLRYATPGAKLSVPFTTLGFHPGMAVTWLLPRLVGGPAAAEMLYTGRVVTGEEGVGLGLVNRTFPAETFLDDVLAVARQVAAKAPLATRLTKQALGREHATLDEALEWESVAQGVTMTTEDLREGITAQRERRTPVFTGR
jgi:enoyl-CoA hydratase/carnithine racemase